MVTMTFAITRKAQPDAITLGLTETFALLTVARAVVVVGSSVCKVQAFTVHVAAPQHKAVYAVGHAHIHAYIHTYIHTYTHTYIHTYIHAYIHTYIHTYI